MPSLCLPAAFVGCVLASCGGSVDPHRELVASWGEHVVLPLYREFEERSAALAAEVGTLCSAPSTEALEAARAAWWTARGPWKQTEVLAFGPTADEPLRLGPKIDFWPARERWILQVLEADGAFDLENAGAAARGLPVVEFLLWAVPGDGEAVPGRDAPTLVEELVGHPRRCGYLVAAAEDLAANASRLRRAWDPGEGNYLGRLVEPGVTGESMFASPHDVLAEVVNRMGFTIENIRADKLGRPLGNDGAGDPRPGLVESAPSGRSLDDIRDNLRGIELLAFGDGSSQSLGLVDLTRRRGLGVEDELRARLDASRTAVDRIPEPLAVAVATAPDRVRDAIGRLGELQRLIQVDILNGLSLSRSFNDNDGD